MAANPAPHVIIGHSMGGHMLLRLLIERPPAIAAAVLSAPMIDVNSAPMPPLVARMVTGAVSGLGLGSRGLWKAPLAVAPAGSRRQQVLTSCVDRYNDEAYWWGQEPDFAPAAPTFGWLRAAYRSARAFTQANLMKVKLPVLLIGAEDDRLVSAAATRRAATALPNAELEMYSGCAHEILRERDATRLAALARIDAFLDRHTA
jgi:lysophospholipase